MNNALTLYGGKGGNNFGGPSGPNGSNILPPIHNHKGEEEHDFQNTCIIGTKHMKVTVGRITTAIDTTKTNSSTIMPIKFELNSIRPNVSDNYLCMNVDELYKLIISEAQQYSKHIEKLLITHENIDTQYIYKILVSQHNTFVDYI
jgi:hypothetical protein